MPKPKAKPGQSPFKISLEDLDLFGGGSSSESEVRRGSHGNPLPRVPAKAAQVLAQAADPDLPPIPVRPKWRAEARVVVQWAIRCKCGQEYFTPGPQGILVRFRSRRDPKLTWETADHPSQEHEGLPIEVRVFQGKSDRCHRCLWQRVYAPPTQRLLPRPGQVSPPPRWWLEAGDPTSTLWHYPVAPGRIPLIPGAFASTPWGQDLPLRPGMPPDQNPNHPQETHSL